MARGPRPGGGPLAGGLDARGAVDLGALAQAREAQAKAAQRQQARASGGAEAAAAAVVVDVTEATFQAEVVDRSSDVPVVIDFWAEWCGPCKQLSPILETLAQEYEGRWVLAKIDVDADPRLGQAFGVQSIPSLFAVVAGQPIPLFQGALPEPQIRQVLDELLKVAAENGVTGRLAPTGVDGADGGVEEDSALLESQDPELDLAADAISTGDFAAAIQAYEALLRRAPGHPDGTAGLALVGLMQRTAHTDTAQALAAVADGSADSATLMTAADAHVLAGRPEAAFSVLIDGVRSATGAERDALRQRVLELFEVVGPQDPSVAPARLALANALF